MRTTFWVFVILVNLIEFVDLECIRPAQFDGAAAALLSGETTTAHSRQAFANSLLDATIHISERSLNFCAFTLLIATAGLVFEFFSRKKLIEDESVRKEKL